MRQEKKIEGHPRKGFLAFLKSESERQRQNGHISIANNYRSARNSF